MSETFFLKKFKSKKINFTFFAALKLFFLNFFIQFCIERKLCQIFDLNNGQAEIL